MKLKTIFAMLVLLLALAACNGENGYTATADYSGENDYNGITLEQVIQNPESFINRPASELELAGLAANITSRSFYIQCDRCDCGSELMVDFRGSQAFPQEGDSISISGELIQNCCNPDLFMLRSFGYSIND